MKKEKRKMDKRKMEKRKKQEKERERCIKHKEESQVSSENQERKSEKMKEK